MIFYERGSADESGRQGTSGPTPAYAGTDVYKRQVGPKAALAILSVMSPEKVALAASSGDHKAFTAANGVGPKLAQRIALELKDKVGKGLAAGTGFAGNVSAAPAPQRDVYKRQGVY